MALIRQGRIVPDPWVSVADGDALPGDGRPAIVALARWQAERAALLRHDGPLGIRLAPDQPPALIADDLHRFDLVALDFPKFTDGRAYSQARLLRQRWRFAGEIRATGQVLRDQFLFMLRAGFDAFEVKKQSDAEAFANTVKRYSVFYQPTGDGRITALHRRMLLRHSESASQ